ncbi:MAG: hypothetical protein BWY09_00704 [Candidatus Hydrogenedentes bacterium ADurb.Bin179]|nr:MAG: hypothetical protein BWY09_00704 [Candidatus Hydrogenedentes bacterium ADurb.Bin179]
MDDRRHQAQDAAGPLETLQSRPILVQTVEHLGVDGIAGNHPFLILKLLCLQGEIALILIVHLAEPGTDLVAPIRVLAVKEQAAAHNFKALAGRNRFPNRLHAPEGMLNGLKRGLARLAADFNIGFGDRGDHQAVLAGPGRFSYFLNKGDEIVKCACRQTPGAVNLFGVGDDLVHEDQAGRGGVKQVFKRFRTG